MLWNQGGGGGAGVVAKTCTSGDFFSAVDGSGNFTCATPAGSGDVTAVGDCASGDCFTASSNNSSLIFEGSTADSSETTLTVTDPTADRTITLPNRTGKVALERWFDVRDYGAVCDASTDDATAIQSAITAACADGPGGTIYVPAKTCKYGTTLTGCSGLAIIGSESTERASYATTQPHELMYSGTGTGLDLSSKAGVRIAGVRLSASNASFSTGTVLKLDSGSYFYLDRVALVAPNLSDTATSKLISANDVVGLWIKGSLFDRGGYHIYGRTLSSNYTNVVSIKDTVFYRSEVCSIQNAGDTWDVSGSWWQQQGASSTKSTHWCHDAGVCMISLNFAGNMSVDQPSGPTNGEFVFCGTGLSVTGNFIGGNTTQDGILFDEACDGCSVQGNWFGFLDEAVKFSGGGTSSAGLTLLGNSYSTVTTKVGGTRPTQSIMQENTGGTIVNEPGDIWLNADTDANSNAGAVVIGSNATSTSATHQFDFTEAYAQWRRGNDLRFYDADDSNYVEATVGAVNITSNKTLTIPDATGTIAVSASAPLVLNATTGNLTLTQNTGTDVTADLEEETHASEHSLGGTDPITVTNLASACSDAQVLGGDAGGTGVECQTDDDVPEAADYSNLTAGTGITNSPTGTINATLGTAITSSEITDGEIVNADVNASAAILFSKLATTNTDKLLGRDTAGGGAVEEIGLTSPLAFTGASAVQIGDVTDCSANQYVNAVGANLALSCAQPDHGNLAGLADDDHTQYWLLAGRTGSQAAILSTNNNGTVTLANSGGAGSGTGTIYGSGKTGENLKLQPNSANTTTGSVKVDGYLDFWSSIATNSSPVNVSGFSPTVTLSDGGGYSLVDFNPTLSVPDISAVQAFRARGSIDRTGTTGSLLYQFTGFHMGTTFTSSTTGGPLFQDAFFDASVISQTSGTATQNTYQPISFLSKPTYKAASGATLTIGQTTGVDINPSWGVAAGGTLTNTTFSAFKLHTPNKVGGTLSLPTYIGVDLEDLSIADVTTPLSMRSVGTTTEMRHAGPARFGATGAVTSGKKLDVQGDTYIGTYLDIGDDLADISTGTTKVIDIAPAIDITSNGTLTGVDVSSTGTTSGTANHYGLKAAPVRTVSGDLAAFYGVEAAGTLTQTGSPTFGTVGKTLNHVTTYTTATAGVKPAYRVYDVFGAPTLSSSATSSTSNVNTVWGHWSNPTVSQTGNGGTLAVASMIGAEYTGTVSAGTGGTTTVTTRTAVKVNDVAKSASGGTETVGTNVGVDIAALSGATTNIGIRNADTTVYTPPSTVTVGAGFTLTADATTAKIDASAARDSSTSTAINDGVADGQIFTIVNVDSTDIITVKNQANTKLGNDCVLTPSSTLTVIWSSDAADWIKVACSTAEMAPITKKATSDTTNATTTIGDITGLTGFPMVSGARYRIQGRLVFSTSATTTDIDLAFNLSAATSAEIDVTTQCQITSNTAGTTTTVSNQRHSADDTKVFAADTGIVTNNACFIEGTILNGNADGTLDLRQAAHGVGTLTIVARGSYITLQRMPL